MRLRLYVALLIAGGVLVAQQQEKRETLMRPNKVEEHAFFFGKHMKLYLPSHDLLRRGICILHFPVRQGNHLQPPPSVGVHGGFGGGSGPTGTIVGATPDYKTCAGIRGCTKDSDRPVSRRTGLYSSLNTK